MNQLSESSTSSSKRSLKSRSLINGSQLDGILNVNDDEAERREVEDQRRQQEIEESATKATKKRRSIFQLIAEYKNLSPSERAAHYQKCLQMSSENKINTQNAFSLLLIDQMAQMMKEKSQMDNFQIAGCTLDASSKIYACRVDVVHTEAMRIARGFNKQAKKKVEENGDSNSDNEEAGNKSPIKTKKIRKRSVLAEKNSQTLIAEPEQDGYTVHQKDMIFEEMTTSAEASEPGNCHFITSIKVQDSQCKLMLQSEIPFCYSSQDTATYFLPDKICFLLEHFPVVMDSFICPTLRSHCQSDAPILEQKEVQEGLQALTSLEENEEVFDTNFDEPEPFDDEAINEITPDKAPGFDMVMDDEESLEMEVPPTACRKVAKPETIVEVASKVSLTALEYSFFQQKAVNLLGGPERWKIGTFFSVQSSKNPTKRKRKEIAVVTYNEEEFVSCSSNTKLTNRTMQTWTSEKLLMPPVQHEVLDFFKLWTLPRMKPKRSFLLQKELDNDADDITNIMDASDCNDTDFGDTANYQNPFINVEQENVNELRISDENEINSIITHRKEHVLHENVGVAPIVPICGFLPFALRAKKIDMKQLKGAIFGILIDTLQNKENANSNLHFLKFTQLYCALPCKLDQKMAENLTPHLAFMALLHLANEKALIIQDQKDLTDLKIAFECI